MAGKKLMDYLDQHQVQYKLLDHDPAYTAQEAAAKAAVSGRQFAKSVMIKADQEMKMAVLSAVDKVDFRALEKILGAEEVRLASEEEFGDLFPDCDLGAMPPFGNLYGVEVLVDRGLSEEMTIAFCAGTHTQLVRMSGEDFQALANPRVADFAR